MDKNNRQQIDPTLNNGAVYVNIFKSINPSIQSTGFRTNSQRYNTLGHSNDPRLAEEFLINTRYRRNDREVELSVVNYFSDPSVVMLSKLGEEQKAGFRLLSLPKGVRLHMQLGEAIGRRRSVRNYTGDAMELDYLATIVRNAAGITGQAEVNLMGEGQSTLRFRATPSGGGLYPIDLYLAALNVRNLERGIYQYDPLKDKLWQTGERSDVENLLQCFAVPDEVISISRANVIFLLVGQSWRTMRKYGNRGMRYIFLEAGAMAENIDLATVALGFGSVECASIYDDEAHEAMNLDGLYQTILHTVIVGNPG